VIIIDRLHDDKLNMHVNFYLDYDDVILTPSGFNRLLACMGE